MQSRANATPPPPDSHSVNKAESIRLRVDRASCRLSSARGPLSGSEARFGWYGTAITVLALVLFVGCGGSPSSTPAPNPRPAPAPAPPPTPAPPATPANLRVTDQGPDFVAWQWDPVTGATGYQVEVSIGDDSFSPPDELGILPANLTAVRFEDESLSPGTSVYLRVRAFSGSEASPVYGAFTQPVAGSTTGAPPPPPPPPDDHGDARSAATRIPVNSSTNGELEIRGDVDFFRFEVPPSGGSLRIETSGPTDTVGTLYLPDGTTIFSDDDGVDNNFAIVTVVPGGTYFVEVGGFENSATGPYLLVVSFSGGPSLGSMDLQVYWGATPTLGQLEASFTQDVGRPPSSTERETLRRYAEWQVPEGFVFGCRVVASLRQLAVLSSAIDAAASDVEAQAAAVLAFVGYADSMLRSGNCATFFQDQAIEWTGELTGDSALEGGEAIRVWGTPSTSVPVRSVARSLWWVERVQTTFNPGPLDHREPARFFGRP